MARYRHYDYNQLMMVPVSLAEQLMPGTLEHAIHHVVEERLDLSMFDDRYCNDDTGRKAIDPKVLIKIVLFGYSRGLISSRSLERACRENIIFMVLACGQMPDHSTIAAFVSSLGEEGGHILIINYRRLPLNKRYKGLEWHFWAQKYLFKDNAVPWHGRNNTISL